MRYLEFPNALTIMALDAEMGMWKEYYLKPYVPE